MTEDLAATTDDDLAFESDLRPPKRLMAVGGAIGLLAATMLTIDKIHLLEDKVAGTDSSLNCDISAFVSCSGVMDSDQASAFGFANSVIGVIGFSVVMTLGILLWSGVSLPRWIWGGLQAGALFGIGFVTWLQSQSIFDINLLCPWCMVVWAVMIPLFVLITAHNLRLFAPGNAVNRFLDDWSVLVVALWYVALVAVIWFQFGPERLFA